MSNDTWNSLRLIQWTTDFFERKGIPNPRLDAELLLAHALGWKRIDLYVRHDQMIPQKNRDHFRSLIERRAQREPLQYILGETEFWGLRLRLTPDVLIPRPETEILVEEVLKAEAADLLDIGTGSGAISIAIATQKPTARIFATDISEKALDVARENVKTHGLNDRIHLTLADIAPWRVFQVEGRSFDAIVSNPPYIAESEFETLQTEVRDFEPKTALVSGDDGLDHIRRIIEESHPFLKEEGRLFLEIGEEHANFLSDNPGRFSSIDFAKDHQGAQRIAILKK